MTNLDAVIVCRDPTDGAYRDIGTPREPMRIAPALLPDWVLDLTASL